MLKKTHVGLYLRVNSIKGREFLFTTLLQGPRMMPGPMKALTAVK